MTICDTMCNLRFDHHGMAKCHAGADEVLTPTGDTTLIRTEGQRIMQSVLLWLSVKLGERFDPKLGCILFKYVFDFADESIYTKMEFDIKENLQYNFPQWNWQSVTVQRARFPDDDVPKVAILIWVQNESFSFIVDGPNLLEYHAQVQRTLKMAGLEYITKTRGA